jgi:cob(I)alamin adenosyltransferase
MSIVTRTGDQGTTSLMYNRRVPKSDPHVEACGSVDELNAALGLARASATAPVEKDSIASIQRDLISLMGELATATEDLKRYVQDGYPVITAAMTRKLEDWVTTLEQHQPDFRGWATPGANLHSAALDMARTACRRAERRVCDLLEAGQVQNPEIVVYLNRLSDLLWLLARKAEQVG